MSQDVNQTGFKPGTVKTIKLVNFMCHDSFELSFGPRVNFVIGPNGSGKSALLTALVVALGGRATTTNRARKNSDFVMYGKKYTKISVTIHNYDKVMDKERAFKPDDYGKFIVVEKIIYKDDLSKLALRNDKDKKVSERKQELDEMLEHFGILINNPICILNQEVSKTFLHSKRPEDKFELFMKATNLEQIELDYEKAKQSYIQWEDCNNRSTVAFKLLDAEYSSCQEKTKFLKERAKLNDVKAALVRELIWAILRDREKECDGIKHNIRSIDSEIEKIQADMAERGRKIDKCAEDIELFKAQAETMKLQLEKTKEKHRQIGLEGAEQRRKQVDIKNKIATCERYLCRLNKDREDAEEAIEKCRRQLREQNAQEQDGEQLKLEMSNLERDIQAERAKHRNLDVHVQQLSSSMTNIRGELHSANSKTNDQKTKLMQAESHLRKLKNSQENELRKYGDYVIRVREEIDRAHSQGRFKHKPLGPLGYYLKLENSDVAGPLEIHLGRNAHAFICDNYQDMSTLTAIFRKLSSGSRDFKQPMIINRPFSRRHDVSKHATYHDTYKTLLDYLQIDNDAIYNALVDRTSLECVLYIPDYKEAQDILITSETVPPNIRCAYTRDSSLMYPVNSAGGYRSYSNDTSRCVLFSKGNLGAIQECEREIERIKYEIRDAENIAKRIQESMNAQRKEYDETNQEIRRVIDNIGQKEDRLANLRLTVTHEPQELQGLEETRDETLNNIAKEKVNLQQLKDSLVDIDKDVDDFLKEKASCADIMRAREADRQSIIKKIDDTRETMTVCKDFVKHNENILDARKRELEKLNQSLDEALEKLAKQKQETQAHATRPNRIGDTQKLQEEMRRVDAEIKAQQEDMMDPEEVIRNLNKRMQEIEDMSRLKDMNLSNARTTSKTLDMRAVGFDNLRKHTIAAVAGTFSSVMRSMKMNGVLEIHIDDLVHHGEVIKKAKTLEIRIDTNYNPSQRVGSVMGDSNNNMPPNGRSRLSHSQPAHVLLAPSRPKRARLDESGTDESTTSEKENEVKMTDTRSLSGGERSFSTVAFVLALWQHCASPFKLMDEIDVFMDLVTRRISYNALIRFAQCAENPGQFIFFSPLELPKFDDSDAHVCIFEMPAIIRKGAASASQPLGPAGDSHDVDNNEDL